MIRLTEFKSWSGSERKALGANSADFTATPYSDSFITVAAGATGSIASKATSASELFGSSITRKVYASDNQTVAKLPLDFIPTEVDCLYDVTISGGTVTVANENYLFKLKDDQSVDGTTGSTTTGQLRLVEFVSASFGRFRITGTQGK